MRLVERLSAPLLFFLVAAFAVTASVNEPFNNWDMVAYIAAAKSFEERDIESLHSFTYQQLRNSLPRAEYEELVQGDYEHAISADWSAFREQLPFYQIRPVYTGLIYLLYKIGVNIVSATHVVSGIGVVAALALLYLMSVSFLAKPLIYTVPPLALVFGMLDLARSSTPDGLVFLAVILSAYLYLRHRITQLLILLPIMLGIRTDLILFTIPLLFFIFLFERTSRWKAALAVLTSVAIYIGILAYWKNPGWSTTFYCTLVQPLIHPISMPPTLTRQHYFHALFRGIKSCVNNKSLVLYVLAAAYSLHLIKKQAKATSLAIALRSPSAALAIVCFVFVMSHFLAFPVPWNRFFSGAYMTGAFSFLVLMSNHLKVSYSA